MRKLLDATDRRRRALQHFCLIASTALLVGGSTAGGALPVELQISVVVLGAFLFIFSASIKQRWEIEYRGHRIRFENSAVTAERLFLDEGLVARGGFGSKMELRAPIRVGDGAGEEIVALVDARFTFFRLRIFVESEDEASPHAARIVEPTAPLLTGSSFAAATDDLQPVIESAVLGKIILAKHVLEFIAALIGVVGGLTAVAVWLF